MKLVTPAPVTSPKRSAAKMISWRAIAATDTFVISYLVTGSFTWAGSIVGIETVSKMLLYYLHERGWAHIAWGTAKLSRRRSRASPCPEAPPVL